MTEDRKQPSHYYIPAQLRQNDDLQPTDAFVYAAIYWFACMKYKKCTASNRAIAEAANVSPTTVSTCLSRLEKNGYINRLWGENQNRKEVVPLIVPAKHSVQSNKGGNDEKDSESVQSDKEDGEGVSQTTKGGESNDAQNNKTTNSNNTPLKEKNIKKQKSPHEMSPKEFNQSFFDHKTVWDLLREEALSTTDADPEFVDDKFEEFWLYWTEPNESGTKKRWELEATFDVKRRLRTWFKNADKFSGKDKSTSGNTEKL
jgi:hypothetical protein